MQETINLNTPKKTAVTTPKVGIVIVNFNSWTDLNECLPYVLQSDYKNFEVIIVDNASTDGSAEKIRKQYSAQTTLIVNTVNTGCGAGNNTGIRHALKNGSRYVFLLNADTKINIDTISKLVAAAEADPKIGMISPVINYYNSPDTIQYCGSAINWSNFTIQHFRKISDFEKANPEDIWLWGTMLLVKAELLNKIGLYNENFFVYCEDQELGMRARKAGYAQVILKNHTAYHKSHAFDTEGIKGLPLYFFFYITRNEYLLWVENMGVWQKMRFNIKYLDQVLDSVGHCKDEGLVDAINAHLDGLYCGWTKKYRKWDPNSPSQKMPAWLKKILVAHPYLISDILNLRIKKIINKTFKKNPPSH